MQHAISKYYICVIIKLLLCAHFFSGQKTLHATGHPQAVSSKPTGTKLQSIFTFVPPLQPQYKALNLLLCDISRAKNPACNCPSSSSIKQAYR
jgi:hypothetical protein